MLYVVMSRRQVSSPQPQHPWLWAKCPQALPIQGKLREGRDCFGWRPGRLEEGIPLTCAIVHESVTKEGMKESLCLGFVQQMHSLERILLPPLPSTLHQTHGPSSLGQHHCSLPILLSRSYYLIHLWASRSSVWDVVIPAWVLPQSTRPWACPLWPAPVSMRCVLVWGPG